MVLFCTFESSIKLEMFIVLFLWGSRGGKHPRSRLLSLVWSFQPGLCNMSWMYHWMKSSFGSTANVCWAILRTKRRAAELQRCMRNRDHISGTMLTQVLTQLTRWRAHPQNLLDVDGSWWHGRCATVPIFCASVADGKKAQLKYSSPENPVPSVWKKCTLLRKKSWSTYKGDSLEKSWCVCRVNN